MFLRHWVKCSSTTRDAGSNGGANPEPPTLLSLHSPTNASLLADCGYSGAHILPRRAIQTASGWGFEGARCTTTVQRPFIRVEAAMGRPCCTCNNLHNFPRSCIGSHVKGKIFRQPFTLLTQRCVYPGNDRWNGRGLYHTEDWTRPRAYAGRIRTLTCAPRHWGEKTPILAGIGASMPTDLFSKLQHLHWYCKETSQLHIFLTPIMKSIRLNHSGGLSPSDLSNLAQRCPALKNISMESADGEPTTDNISAFVRTYWSLKTLQVWSLDWDALQHVLHMPNIRSLNRQSCESCRYLGEISKLEQIDIGFACATMPAHVLNFYRALSIGCSHSSLTVLHLTGTLWSVLYIEECRVTLGCLRALGHYCPHLESLKITLDASVVPEYTASDCTPQTCLHKLTFPYSPITTPLAVARFLLVLFPTLESIALEDVSPPNEDDEEEVARYSAWETVRARCCVSERDHACNYQSMNYFANSARRDENNT
ncbi:hypothetical protein C8R43DRAFT_948023 [Mycena crocata]|nr:hypothetical protein C8R43DRAFT_948023 [Mycena crocata]